MQILYHKLTEFCDIALSQYVHQFKSVILSCVFKQKKRKKSARLKIKAPIYKISLEPHM